MDHQHPSAPASALITAPEPGDLDVAITVAHRMLASYGSVGYSDIGAYAQAHGALTESLRILLRALGAERVSELHRLCDEDFIEAEARRQAQNHRDDAHLTPQHCPAAHPEDTTPCDGRPVVTVLDANNDGANGCERHAARLLASLERGRVYALSDAPDGAAIRVFKASADLRPFCWYGGEDR